MSMLETVYQLAHSLMHSNADMQVLIKTDDGTQWWADSVSNERIDGEWFAVINVVKV